MKYILIALSILSAPNISQAGNCSGTQCGCHEKSCWSFQYSNSKSGDPWCYTQTLGTKKGQASWAACKNHKDCSWEMTCGNNRLFFGSNPEHFLDIKGTIPNDTASKEEKEIAVIKLRAAKDIKVAGLKFKNALEELKKKYESLVDKQSQDAKADREKLIAVIIDLCDMAGVKVPEWVQE